MNFVLNHIALTTANLRGSSAFWETVFDAQPIERPTSGVSPDGAWYRIGNLELHLQYRQKPRQKTDQHFALVTGDAEEIAERARRMGRQVEVAEAIPGFSKRFFLYDPDGNRVEVLQH